MSKALATTTSENDPSKWDDKFDRIIKWYNDEREDDDPKKIKLHKDLEEQLKRWDWLYNKICLPKNRYKTDIQLIKLVKKQYPDLSERTARRTLQDMRRFFGVVSQPELAFEKVMLIASIKQTQREAVEKGDLKAKNAADKNLIAVMGADKQQQAVENTTIINIVGYHPEQLGVQILPEEQIEALINDVLNADRKAAENPFADFIDVTGK
ncbi:hypothetical protein GCM10028805_47440 [Spirosoma harenae]